MKRDLWSSKQNRQDTAAQGAQVPPDIDPQLMQDAQSAIEHYSGMNENDLMSELQNIRQAGGIDERALQQMSQTVSPMLTEEQKLRLDALLRQLRQ